MTLALPDTGAADELDACSFRRPRMRAEFLDRDRRAVDEDLRQLALGVGDDAVLAEIDLFEVFAFRDDGEQHVDAGEIGELVDDFAAELGPAARPSTWCGSRSATSWSALIRRSAIG